MGLQLADNGEPFVPRLPVGCFASQLGLGGHRVFDRLRVFVGQLVAVAGVRSNGRFGGTIALGNPFQLVRDVDRTRDRRRGAADRKMRASRATTIE